MARIRIKKNAGPFRIEFSGTLAYRVMNDKTGGNQVIIPCKRWKQAEELCKKLNNLDRHKEHEIWI